MNAKRVRGQTLVVSVSLPVCMTGRMTKPSAPRAVSEKGRTKEKSGENGYRLVYFGVGRHFVN